MKKMIGLLCDHGYELVAPIFDGAIIRRKEEATEIKPLLDAVTDATNLAVALKPFPPQLLELEAMGSSRYYARRLSPSPPSSNRQTRPGSILRYYADPWGTSETRSLANPPTLASVFRDFPRAVQDAPHPCALTMCLPYAISQLFPQCGIAQHIIRSGATGPFAIRGIPAMTGLKFYESTGVRDSGRFLVIEQRSGLWHCVGIQVEGASFALYDNESKYARVGRVGDIPDLSAFLIASVESGEDSRRQMYRRRNIPIAGRRFPRGEDESRARDEDTRGECDTALPASSSHMEFEELPIDARGDVCAAPGQISTTEETPRELSDGGTCTFIMAVGDGSQFSAYIDDEVESALRAASEPYAKVGTRGYECALCPEKKFSQRIRLVRHIKTIHVDSGAGKPATSKTLQLALALYNWDQVMAGIGIATGTCTPAGKYLSRSSALISQRVREFAPEDRREDGRGDLTSGRITALERRIALCPTSRGPSLLPVAYLGRPDFRRVGNAYYSHCYGRLVLAMAIGPATKGRPESVRVSILRYFLSIGCESAFLLPSDYRSTMQVTNDVIGGPPRKGDQRPARGLSGVDR